MLVKIAAAFLEDEMRGADPARIFVMDEPTAALTGEESRRLFRIIDVLRGRGCGIIYVSHRLDEVLAISDRITVFRDGEAHATFSTKEATKSKLIEAMTGRKASEFAPGRNDFLRRTRCAIGSEDSVAMDCTTFHSNCIGVKSSALSALLTRDRSV